MVARRHGRPATGPRPRRAGAAVVAALAVACGWPISPAPAADRPETVHDTRIRARWNEAERTIEGSQRLRWTNTSSAPVEELRFHLYLNAFANNRSTFMRSGARVRGRTMPEDGWGYTEIRSLRLESVAAVGGEARDLEEESGLDLLPGQTFLAPDDGNPDDRTLASFPLPFPVPPGATIELSMEFSSRMPKVFTRTGATGDFILAGQWFPKPAVLEDAGERGRTEPGWSSHQFHSLSEFYADFGNYDVTLDLPARYLGKIGATGRMVEERENEGRAVARFVQEGVHDFAWTAFPGFEVVRDRFDPDSDVPVERREQVAALLGMEPDELRLEPVEITLLLPSAHRFAVDRYLHAAKVGLREMGLHLGAYPYGTLTLVDPPRGAMGSSGMEYPTFITLGTMPLLGLPGLRGVRSAESVTVHEFAHQYFQGQVASNEVEESWLDEGFTQYWESKILDDEWGEAVRLPGLALTAGEAGRRSLLAPVYDDPIVKPSWEFRNVRSYAFNSYSRTAAVLRHLERLLGPERFHRALREYFRTWRFRHPSTEDFLATFQRAAGEDLTWFFDQAIRTTRRLDYGIRRAGTRRESEPEGWFGQGEDRRLLPGDAPEGEAQGEAGPDAAEQASAVDPDQAPQAGTGDEDAEPAPEEETIWVSNVTAFRYGEFIHPVTVEFEFADGVTTRDEWDGKDRWRIWEVRRPARLTAARVDPDDVLVLDANRLNDGRLLREDPVPRRRFVAEALLLLQFLFDATGWTG